MADLFVSYSRQDKARVARLVAALEAEGWTVWWDAAIAPGQEFDRLIEQELRSAGAVVVVWTPTSVASRWVRGEARFAADLNTLIPVRFDAAELPLDVRALHTTDLDAWEQDRQSDALLQLTDAIRALVAPSRAPTRPPSRPSAPGRSEFDTAIAALEARRDALGDAVVDAALAGLRANSGIADDSAAQTPQLKQVTLLFVDATGGTLAGDAVHPEDLHEAMSLLLRRVTRVVERYHGQVLSHTGDAILAVFGGIVAAESDAENAVRAGLAIVAAEPEVTPEQGRDRQRCSAAEARRADHRRGHEKSVSGRCTAPP